MNLVYKGFLALKFTSKNLINKNTVKRKKKN